MIITMFATLCHMATVSPGMPPVEFCQEQIVGRADKDVATKKEIEEAVTGCFTAAQMEIAARLLPGFTVKEIRCEPGNGKPKGSI